MQTLKAEVYAALQATGYATSHRGASAPASFPCIEYAEADNSSKARAGGREHLTNLEYYIDLYATTPEEIQTMLEAVDAKMDELGLVRSFATDRELYNDALSALVYQKPTRYRCNIDTNGVVYQS